MQIKIQNGIAELSGNTILSEINIEINTASKIAVVGRNGCGKTTLLRVISGKLTPSKNNGKDFVYAVSGKPVIGMLEQMSFDDESRTMIEEIRSAYSQILDLKKETECAYQRMQDNQSEDNIREYTSLLERFTNMGGFYFEKEYEAAIKRFGFTAEDKNRPVGEFSGGQRTKIAFLKLLLSKPDLLLLDEPTNHLDVQAISWLEEYLQGYKKAVVLVSHDRMFIDKTVNEVYEIEYGKMTRYVGNYTDFTHKKSELRQMQQKRYEADKKERERIERTVERFRYKATKAAMAQSKLKQLEKREEISAPDIADTKTFRTTLEPAVTSAKQVLEVDNLCIGFDRPLATMSFSVLRGMRVGIIGGNGLGKSTLLKTLVGRISPISGDFRFGSMVKTGYFEQQMANVSGKSTVLDDFMSTFPQLNDYEARSELGAFMFGGEDVFKTLDILSGGERVRLALCKLFKSSPNLLILDEPTNHMDIPSKEALEDLLMSYTGTLIFVSHDRYFVNKLADKLIVFEDGGVKWCEYGYSKYTELKNSAANPDLCNDKTNEQTVKPQKKTYTTPAKEKAKRERAIKKAEEKIALIEEKIGGLKEELLFEENASDYIKLGELQAEIEKAEDELLCAMAEWEAASSQDGSQI